MDACEARSGPDRSEDREVRWSSIDRPASSLLASYGLGFFPVGPIILCAGGTMTPDAARRRATGPLAGVLGLFFFPPLFAVSSSIRGLDDLVAERRERSLACRAGARNASGTLGARPNRLPKNPR